MPIETPNKTMPSRPGAARRSPRLIALGVLTVALGGLGAGGIYAASVETREAVIVKEDIARGETIEAGDLTVTEIPGSLAVEAVPGEKLPDLIGQTPLVDLPAGSFPASRHLGEPVIPEGKTLVGIMLSYGRLPRAAMPSGTKVQLVSLVNDDAPTPGVIVTSPQELEFDSYVLDVLVTKSQAAKIARLAATDQLALVVGDQ